MQVFGMFEKLVVKVDHMSVAVAFSQDGDEAKDKRANSEALGIGLNQTFAGQFGCSIKRGLDREGRVFGGWKDRRFTVNRSGGGERNAPGAGAPHGFDDVESRNRILFQILAGMFGTEPDIR